MNHNDTAVNPAAASFLEDLRASTSRAHQNLEKLPVSAALLSPALTLSQYGHYLWLMQNIAKDTETHIFPKLQNSVPDLESRRKSDHLKADLAAIGFGPKNNIPVFGNAPAFSEAFALGIFYVVEGSSLGGRYILKNVQATLNLDQTNGAQYFEGYGAKTGSSWKNFLNAMQAFELKTESGSEIIAGANFAFEAIHNHFASQGHEN